jgi:hypothetical protein
MHICVYNVQYINCNAKNPISPQMMGAFKAQNQQ